MYLMSANDNGVNPMKPPQVIQLWRMAW